MNISPRIHIISLKPEICSLIKKALAGYDYIISSNSGETINENSITRFGECVDCLIIDKNINSRVKEKAKEIFSKSFVIYLPSLDAVESSPDDLKGISAPLKLSELSEKLEGLFKLNKS